MIKIILVANTSWYLYNFRQNIIHSLIKDGCRVICVSPQDQYSIRLSKICYKYSPIQLDRKGQKIFPELFFFLKLISILQKVKPDIVHLFTIKPIIWGTLSARLIGIRKIVVSIVGLGHAFLKNSILKKSIIFIYRFLFRSSNIHIIFQNSHDRIFFTNNKIGKYKQHNLIYGSGVNTDLFFPKKNKRNSDSVRFALFSRMIAEKGISEFIEAAFFINKIYPKTEFILAGDIDLGNPSGYAKEWINRKIDNVIVKWLGHVEDVKNIMEETDVIVLPTYYKEGVPRSLIEAASLELPIITTNIPGCSEIVNNNLNGLITSPKDVPALINAMIWMIENPEARIEMGKNGRKLVLEKFDAKIVVKQTKDIYRL